MSGVIGKGQRSFAKLDVAESNVPAVGFKKLVFMHEASLNDTEIDLSSLTAPAEATANGFLQPSISDLTATNLQQFKENFTLTSTRGIWNQFIDYIITGANKILLLVPAEDGEIFRGVIDLEARTGFTIVDAQPISKTNTLLAGTTDFNVGTPFEINKHPTSQHGAVLVYVDGQLAYRNENNQASGTDGDYYEVEGSPGTGGIIRFNTSDTEDRQVSVISNGALAERPSGSQQAFLDALQGQLNLVTETTEQLAGLTPGALQSTPTTADLAQFGDRVLQNENDIVDLETNKQDKFTPVRVLAYGDATTMSVGSFSIYPFSNEKVDTDGAFTGGEFTVPSGKGGLYRVDVHYGVNDSGIGFTGSITARITVNNTTPTNADVGTVCGWIAGTRTPSTHASIPLQLNPGDVVRVYMIQDTGAARALFNDDGRTYLSIRQETQD